jgi:sulfate adenylyltransferase
MIEPHGGRLVDRPLLDDPAEYVDGRPEIQLSTGNYQDALNVANGRFSPLDGFLKRNDFLKVATDMTLEDGTIWPLPIVLDVDPLVAAELEPDTRAVLRGPEDDPVGVIDVEEVYRYNKREVAREIFGTDDPEHPGVDRFRSQEDFLVGGAIHMTHHSLDAERDLRPAESRVLFDRRGWDTVVGFQTRNAPHRGHEYIQKSALEFVDGLFIQPKLGDKKAGDYADHVITGGYRTLLDCYYPTDRVALSMFPSRMRYAGPREAVFDAIVRKNQGCTHFIIGRDHAGVGDFYDGFDAHRIFERVSDIGIQPLFFSYAFFCEACDGMASMKICPHGDDERIYPSGSSIREAIRRDQSPSDKVMRSVVTKFIIDSDKPFVE